MENPLDFTGKRVLVIGGSSGIGNGIARAFRNAGAQVTVTGRRAEASAYEGEEGSALDGLDYRALDVAQRDAVDRLAKDIASLDVLVLSQGTVRYRREEFAREGWDEVIDVNLNSLMDGARAFHPHLAASKGSLIIISSVAGFKSTMGNPAYAASKAGAVNLVRTLGEAWAREGIRVNGIAPGLVPTKLTAVTTQNDARREASLRAIPLGRMGEPQDLAGPALFLASPLASYIIGQTLIVDGGLTLS